MKSLEGSIEFAKKATFLQISCECNYFVLICGCRVATVYHSLWAG